MGLQNSCFNMTALFGILLIVGSSLGIFQSVLASREVECTPDYGQGYVGNYRYIKDVKYWELCAHLCFYDHEGGCTHWTWKNKLSEVPYRCYLHSHSQTENVIRYESHIAISGSNACLLSEGTMKSMLGWNDEAF